jgi:hypothetical protein
MSIKSRKIKGVDMPVVPYMEDNNFYDNVKHCAAESHMSAMELEKIQSSIPMDKALAWHQDEYAKQWEYSPLPNLKKAKIDKTAGSSLRMSNITTMKYAFNVNTMNQTVVVMKLYDYNLKKETNYGNLFCEMIDDISPVRKKLYNTAAVVGNVTFTFYSASPSHVSADGEYRSRYSAYRSLTTAKEEFSCIWDDLERYISNVKNRRNWSVYANYFYPGNQENTNMNIEAAVKNEMLPMTILIVSWFHVIYDEIMEMGKSHINPNFREIFLNYQKDDILFVKSIITKYGAIIVDKFRANVSHTSKRFYDVNTYMQCGYKMIPLNIQEVRDPMKLKYKPWREYFVSSKINDLVINSVSPTFPITLDWFYIRNSRKGLYDNKSQHDRMKHSELATNILNILYDAQRGTYFASENTIGIKKTKHAVRRWLNNKFKRLNAKIDESIKYSISELITSDVTLSFASEHVGRTIADTINLIQTSKPLNNILGCPLDIKGYDYFAKYIFDIAYGLLCCNKRLGIIHGDLHLNNATIGALYYLTPKQVANNNKTNKVVYVINDTHQYVFPNNGYFASVIDFSRSIMHPDETEKFRDESLPRTQKLIDDADSFRSGEVRALVNLYIMIFPNKNHQRDELIILFKKHFDAVFKLLTCIDLYMFTIRLTRLIANMNITVSNKALNLVNKINRLAEEYIATCMNHLINEPEMYSQKIVDSPFPIESIISKCFSEYNDGEVYKSIGVITDIYILNNPLQYSVDRYKNFPDIFKYVKYYDNNGNIKEIKKVTEKRKTNRDEYETQKSRNLDIVSFIATTKKANV